MNLKQMSYTKILPRGAEEAQEALLLFCKEIGEIDATVFIRGFEYSNMLHGLSVQSNDKGITQIQGTFEYIYTTYSTQTDYLDDDGYGTVFNSPDTSFYSQYIDRQNRSPYGNYEERKSIYIFVASFDHCATLRSIEVFSKRSTERIFSIHIGDKKFLISGQWYEREGFQELAFQHGTVEKPELFDVTVVSTILKELNVE